MNTLTQDRRIRRTKNLLKQGLCNMLEKKTLNTITIKEITDSADLNRSTFYLHYQDIYDLYEQMQNDFINDSSQLLRECLPFHDNDGILLFLEKMIHYTMEHLTISKTLCRQADTKFINHLMNALISCFTNYQKDSAPTYDNTLLQYSFTFFCHGILGVINFWLNEDPSCDPTYITRLLYSFSTPSH